MTMLLKPEMKYQSGVTTYDAKNQYVNKFIADISVRRHWDRKII
jgi:hypothetical protein